MLDQISICSLQLLCYNEGRFYVDRGVVLVSLRLRYDTRSLCTISEPQGYVTFCLS